MGDLKGLSDLFSQVIIVNGPDLLFHQAKPKGGKTDGGMAKKRKGRRHQAQGLSFPPQGLSPPSRPPPAEAKWGRTSALSLIEPVRKSSRAAAKYFTTGALPNAACPKAPRRSRSMRRSIGCGRLSATCERSEAVSPACNPSRSWTRDAPVGI